jgi:hypothetical protein
LRNNEGIKFHFLIQVDTLAHKIPRFIDKAAQAGCKYVFVGLESVNPENLAQMKKGQNRISEYRHMFQDWKRVGAMTYAGYILGLPGDTPQSIRRDIEIVQRELPVDLLEFTMLTPLPGSEDHQRLHRQGVWMEPDLNAYDLECVTIKHSRMSREEWQQVYYDAWDWYYSDAHYERVLKRNVAMGAKTMRIWRSWAQIYGAAKFEGVHPQQCGYFRRRVRTERRAEAPREAALPFYAAHVWRALLKYGRFAGYVYRTWRIRNRVEADPAARDYMDAAITPVFAAEKEALTMFGLSDEAREAIDKARRQAEAHRRHAAEAASG